MTSFLPHAAGERHRVGEPDVAGDRGAPAGTGVDLAGTTERCQPVGHVPRSRPGRGAGRVEARTVVGHGEHDLALVPGQADPYRRPPGVPGGVLERLHAAEVDRGFDYRTARPAAAARHSGMKAVCTTPITWSATPSGTSRTGDTRPAELGARSAAEDVAAMRIRSASPAAMSQATTRHRGDGGRPSGNSRTASANTKPGSPRIAPSQTAQSTGGGAAAPALVAYVA